MAIPDLYKSTDAGMPALTGQSGSLIGVLDATLLPSGWSKVYSATNKAVYRAPVGTRFYLRVLDDGSAADGAKVAAVRGYETMSDVDTGTGPFPTVAQAAGGLFVGKSTTADATARKWAVLVDDRRVVVLTAYSASVTDAYAHTIFGDLLDAAPGDAYAAILFAATTSANAVSTVTGSSVATGNIAFTNAAGGLYAPRAASGAGAAIQMIAAFPNPSGGGSGYTSYTTGPDAFGNVWVDHIQCTASTSTLDVPRGRIPAILYGRNNVPYAGNPSWTMFGSQALIRYNSAHSYSYLIETGDWG